MYQLRKLTDGDTAQETIGEKESQAPLKRQASPAAEITRNERIYVLGSAQSPQCTNAPQSPLLTAYHIPWKSNASFWGMICVGFIRRGGGSNTFPSWQCNLSTFTVYFHQGIKKQSPALVHQRLGKLCAAVNPRWYPICSTPPLVITQNLIAALQVCIRNPPPFSSFLFRDPSCWKQLLVSTGQVHCVPKYRSHSRGH